MNIDNTVDVDESIVVNLNPTHLQTLYEHFRKRKLIWLIVLIILIVAIIAIPTIIVTVNKGKGEKTTTTTTHITTVEIETATVDKLAQITTIQRTTQTATEELIPSVIIDNSTKWKQSAITVAGENGQGNGLNELNQPWSIYVDDDSGSIYIADVANDRIVRWKFGEKIGEIVAGENGHGSSKDQLSYPVDVVLNKEKKSLIICDQQNRRVIQWSLQNSQDNEILISDSYCGGVAMDNDGNLYVSDQINNEVSRLQQGDKEATTVAGGNGRGNQLNQFNQPMHIFVDKDHSIYVADYNNNRVMKWMKNASVGIPVASEETSGENFNSLSRPTSVIVDHMGNIYVSAEKNPQIMRWSPDAIQGVPVVGEKQPGSGPTQLSYPYDLSFDRQGNLYVADAGNYRIQKFEIDRD
ncbi:unnamed protein product [Adineta steineri]|uniref:NHL repeat containing protein n=1 Tax=Adineta steineri TaxID=433720 RepID=A0A818NIC4_9BILA|nr:unnamed protein product [Adineta steineri]CAF1413364.1 unnamed protein product [Adineta steineri]CAF1454239.1 unnamed protein product [Adineta steineri]CAF3605821.1 unnamed protein product [Adineta steineri]CAF3813177.1 unnamed protein product [Adineta steineri]